MSIRVLALGTVALIAGCDAWLTKPGLYNTVEVIAARRNGDPIPGVALALYTGQRPMGYATTGSDGRYTFERVPQGDYGILATPPSGYDLIEHFISAPSSIVRDKLFVANDTLSPVRFSFLKVGPGTLTVRVTEPSGTPIAGAAVSVYDPKNVNARATTDAAGRASFGAIPFGVHGVLVDLPLRYRLPGDSLFAHRDNLIVEDGSRDSVTFQFTKCVGTIRVLALDQTAAPVAGVTAVVYTSTQELVSAATGADGRATYTQAPCVVQLGVIITPPAGYSVPEGRGSRFIDGLTVADGGTVDVTFRVQKAP